MIILRSKKERFFAMFGFMPAMFLFYLPFAILIRKAYIHVVNTMVESGKWPMPPVWLWISGLAAVLFVVPLFFITLVWGLLRIYKKCFCRFQPQEKIKIEPDPE